MNLVWQFIVHRHSEHEVKDAKRIAKNLPSKPRLSLIPIGLREDIVDFDQYNPQELEDMKKEWLPKNKKYISKHFLKPNRKAIIEERRCSFLWNSVVISVHGVLTPCCFTYKDEHAFGSINDSTIAEIWNNEHYLASRKHVLEPESDDCQTVCRNCHNYIRVEHGSNLVETMRYIKWLGQQDC